MQVYEEDKRPIPVQELYRGDTQAYRPGQFSPTYPMGLLRVGMLLFIGRRWAHALVIDRFRWWITVQTSPV